MPPIPSFSPLWEIDLSLRRREKATQAHLPVRVHMYIHTYVHMHELEVSRGDLTSDLVGRVRRLLTGLSSQISPQKESRFSLQSCLDFSTSSPLTESSVVVVCVVLFLGGEKKLLFTLLHYQPLNFREASMTS